MFSRYVKIGLSFQKGLMSNNSSRLTIVISIAYILSGLILVIYPIIFKLFKLVYGYQFNRYPVRQSCAFPG